MGTPVIHLPTWFELWDSYTNACPLLPNSTPALTKTAYCASINTPDTFAWVIPEATITNCTPSASGGSLSLTPSNKLLFSQFYAYSFISHANDFSLLFEAGVTPCTEVQHYNGDDITQIELAGIGVRGSGRICCDWDWEGSQCLIYNYGDLTPKNWWQGPTTAYAGSPQLYVPKCCPMGILVVLQQPGCDEDDDPYMPTVNITIVDEGS